MRFDLRTVAVDDLIDRCIGTSRFSQADSSDGRSRGGTGLGMAIAKHLTEQMSGRISFESEENVGTIFHLEFPLASSRPTQRSH
jgi:signal transduction histidine kinase